MIVLDNAEMLEESTRKCRSRLHKHMIPAKNFHEKLAISLFSFLFGGAVVQWCSGAADPLLKFIGRSTFEPPPIRHFYLLSHHLCNHLSFPPGLLQLTLDLGRISLILKTTPSELEFVSGSTLQLLLTTLAAAVAHEPRW